MSTNSRYNTIVSRVSDHGRLNITIVILGRMGAYLGSNSIRLYRRCYSAPLKCGTWALSQEWALARDTMVILNNTVELQLNRRDIDCTM